MRYRHVVFDLDGTIVDNEYVILQSLRDTLRELTGVTHGDDELKFSLGVPAVVPLERFGVADVSGATALWRVNMLKYAEFAKPFPEVVRVLGLLRDEGFVLGVVTSRTRAEYDEEFLPYGLGGFFGVSICADDTVRHKPDAEPLLAYLGCVGCERVEAIYVGDSRYDMECACGAGVDGGHALWGASIPAYEGARYHFSTPDELLVCVRGV